MLKRRSFVSVLMLVALLALPAVLLTGCKCPMCSGKKCESAQAVLCGKCGQVKGSMACCVAGAEKCDKCGMVKGSPGCCQPKS